MLTPGKLAKKFGISRTALLHYDAIGLLTPRERTPNRYRQYSAEDERRLEQIRRLREAGLALKDIKRVLASPDNVLTQALHERLDEINREVTSLRDQQRFILGLLKSKPAHAPIPVMSKALWISLLESAGYDQAARLRWHCDFEGASPSQHRRFLKFLNLDDHEIAAMREGCRAERAPARGHGRYLGAMRSTVGK